MQKELEQAQKSPKRFSIIRIVITLAILSSIAFLIIRISKYQKNQKIQEQIQSGLSSANLILIAPTSDEAFLLKSYFDYRNDPEYKNDFKGIIKVNSSNDINNIIDNFILDRSLDKEACRCNGSHYLAFYNNKTFLGIIQIKHAEVFVFYNNNKFQGHYYINKSAIDNIKKILIKYKVNLKK